MVSNLGASKTATGWRQHVCLTLRLAMITTSLPPTSHRVVCSSWTSIEQACVAGWQLGAAVAVAALVAQTTSHARRLGILPWWAAW
jgi:hypothetical protein